LSFYSHADWLSTSRLATTASRTVYFDQAYAPFGEGYQRNISPSDPPLEFAGMFKHTATGYYDTPNREYHPVQGRWISPDPAGLAAVKISNPQSWNRYAYVGNNPLSFFDPLGLSPNCVAHTIDYYVDGQYDSSMIFLDCTDDSPGGGSLVNTGVGGGAGGGGTNCAPGTKGCFNVPGRPSQGSKCISSFQNSTFGKAVDFFSAINLVTNLTSISTVADWTVVPAVKYSILQGTQKASSAIGNTEFLSVTGASASTTVEAPLAAGIDAAEAASGPGLLVIPLATAIDAGVRDMCSSFPDMTITLNAPVPSVP
jgi:RHS repeat-associated protein